MRQALLRNGTVKGPKGNMERSFHASSNCSPDSWVNKSMRRGGRTDLKRHPGFRKIPIAYVGQGCAKLFECAHNFESIVRRRMNRDIQIASRSGINVEVKRICAHDEESCFSV